MTFSRFDQNMIHNKAYDQKLLYFINFTINMSNILKLFFTTNPSNSITGEVQKGIDFGMILDTSFDLIPLKGNKNYSLYNSMVIDIRNARRKESEFIEVAKSDLEQLKLILIDATETNPLLNRKVSFLTEVIEKAISDSLIDDTVHEKVIQ